MTIAKAFRTISLSCYKERSVTKAPDDTRLVIIHDKSFDKKNMSAPPSVTDVHNCRSLRCIACSKPGTISFIKVDVPDRTNQSDAKSNDNSRASTASSSLSPSQRTLTPPSSVSRQKKILFENISSVGVIRAFSDANRPATGDELRKPYTLTRSRSVSDEESLKQFIESIESTDTCDEEDDVDGLIFDTPWKGKN